MPTERCTVASATIERIRNVGQVAMVLHSQPTAGALVTGSAGAHIADIRVNWFPCTSERTGRRCQYVREDRPDFRSIHCPAECERANECPGTASIDGLRDVPMTEIQTRNRTKAIAGL